MIYRIGLMVTDELIKDAQYGKKLREGHHQPDQFHMIFSNGRYFYGLYEHLLFWQWRDEKPPKGGNIISKTIGTQNIDSLLYP